jgi:hypothetical protein
MDFTSNIIGLLGQPAVKANQFDQLGRALGQGISGYQKQQATQQAAQEKEQDKQEALYLSRMINTKDMNQRNAIMKEGYSKGYFDDDVMSAYAESTPEQFERIATDSLRIDGYGGLIDRASEGFTLGAGDTRYDASGNVIAQGSESKKSAKLEKIDTGDSIELVDSSTGETIRTIPKSGSSKELDKQIKAADRKFKQTNDLRAEVRKVDPAFIKVQDAFTNVEASAKDPSAAGDLALIFNYMKVLDPGSAVKEGEFATAASAGGVDERVFGLYNRIINGERLTDGQRADFLDRATRLYGANDKKFQKRTKGILKQANQLGIPLDEIGLGRFSADAGGSVDNPTPKDTQPAAGANITTQAQYDALPSGAIYMEDGKRYQKP